MASATLVSVSAVLARVALLAQVFEGGGQVRHLLLAARVPGLSSSLICVGQGGALLQAFLFLRGEALNFVDDGVDLLVQRRAANSAAR